MPFKFPIQLFALIIRITCVDISKELETLAMTPREIKEEEVYPNEYYSRPNKYKGHKCYKIQELDEQYIMQQQIHLHESLRN